MPILTIEDNVFEFEGSVNVRALVEGMENVVMPCGGHGICGKCKVFAIGNFNPPTEDEISLLSEKELKDGIRLACFLKATGDGEIRLSENFAGIRIISDGVMPRFSITPELLSYGVAVDVGTTTICARLYDEGGRLISESSRLNSQKSFGADVISRIEAQLSGKGRLLSSLVREDIICLILDMAKSADISPEAIDKVVITGNTTMLHLLTGTDAKPLSCAPFKPTRLFGETLTAGDLGIVALRSNTEFYIPPCISAFVGADTVCALLASDILDKKGTNLLVDIGTNGEVALLKDGSVTVCSTAAGPAFEGAYLTSGMMGHIGAIDKVWTENGKIAYHVIGEGEPSGICGSGIIDGVFALLQTENIDKTGFIEENFYFGNGVYVTKDDIRAIQLAKSAVISGVYTVLHEENVPFEDLDEFIIAGGFGSRLNLTSAEFIGLIPKGAKKKARVIGNGALAGASMLLLNKDLREKCIEISKSAKNIELSTNAFFAEKYMENMMF